MIQVLTIPLLGLVWGILIIYKMVSNLKKMRRAKASSDAFLRRCEDELFGQR